MFAQIFLVGDADADGFVGQSDLDVVLLNFGGNNATRLSGDLNGDGFVGQADLDQVLLNFGSGQIDASVAAVPEPGMGFLLLGLVARRSRRGQRAWHRRGLSPAGHYRPHAQRLVRTRPAVGPPATRRQSVRREARAG